MVFAYDILVSPMWNIYYLLLDIRCWVRGLSASKAPVRNISAQGVDQCCAAHCLAGARTSLSWGISVLWFQVEAQEVCLVSYLCLFFLLLTYRIQFKITCKKLWLHCGQFTEGYVWVLMSFKLFILPPSIPTGWKDTQKVGVFSHPTTGVCRCFELGPPGKRVPGWEFLWDKPGMQNYFTGEENMYLWVSLDVFSVVNPGHLLALGWPSHHHKIEEKFTWAVEWEIWVEGLLCIRQSWDLLLLKGRSWNEIGHYPLLCISFQVIFH